MQRRQGVDRWQNVNISINDRNFGTYVLLLSMLKKISRRRQTGDTGAENEDVFAIFTGDGDILLRYF
jgi:hypothetical protein